MRCRLCSRAVFVGCVQFRCARQLKFVGASSRARFRVLAAKSADCLSRRISVMLIRRGAEKASVGDLAAICAPRVPNGPPRLNVSQQPPLEL
jgi:hypothetical protein